MRSFVLASLFAAAAAFSKIPNANPAAYDDLALTTEDGYSTLMYTPTISVGCTNHKALNGVRVSGNTADECYDKCLAKKYFIDTEVGPCKTFLLGVGTGQKGYCLLYPAGCEEFPEVAGAADTWKLYNMAHYSASASSSFIPTSSVGCTNHNALNGVRVSGNTADECYDKCLAKKYFIASVGPCKTFLLGVGTGQKGFCVLYPAGCWEAPEVAGAADTWKLYNMAHYSASSSSASSSSASSSSASSSFDTFSSTSSVGCTNHNALNGARVSGYTAHECYDKCLAKDFYAPFGKCKTFLLGVGMGQKGFCVLYPTGCEELPEVAGAADTWKLYNMAHS